MTYNKSLYRVKVRGWEEDQDVFMREENVIATDAIAAAKRVRLKKGEYVNEVEFVSTIDR